MKKKTFFDVLYVVLIISLILFMVWIVQFMKDNSTQCLKDPIGYFEEKNDGASCFCMKDGVQYKKIGEENNPNFPLLIDLEDFED